MPCDCGQARHGNFARHEGTLWQALVVFRTARGCISEQRVEGRRDTAPVAKTDNTNNSYVATVLSARPVYRWRSAGVRQSFCTEGSEAKARLEVLGDHGQRDLEHRLEDARHLGLHQRLQLVDDRCEQAQHLRIPAGPSCPCCQVEG